MVPVVEVDVEVVVDVVDVVVVVVVVAVVEVVVVVVEVVAMVDVEVEVEVVWIRGVVVETVLDGELPMQPKRSVTAKKSQYILIANTIL